MDQKDVLLEQYRIIESRRSYFGKLFWQLPGFFIAVFVGFIGLSDKELSRPKTTYFIGGSIFLLIAWIAQRLRLSQDECERSLEDIERRFTAVGIDGLLKLPHSKKYGARTAVVIALVVWASVLLLMSIPWSVLFRLLLVVSRF
jgi:hypothetical protein